MTTGLLFFLLLVGTVPVAAGRISKPDFSIGINLDHDATTGTFGGATPRVRWNSDEVSVAGWFDVQVSRVETKRFFGFGREQAIGGERNECFGKRQ